MRVRAPGSRYGRVRSTPAASSVRSRSVSTAGGAPVAARMSANRRVPSATSRTTSRAQRSPTTSRVRAMEQVLGDTAGATT